MGGPIGPRTARHWLMQRDLLKQASATLVLTIETAQHNYTDLGLNSAEWNRLVYGTAGFPLVVKVAGKLGLLVEIRFGQADGEVS